MSSKTVVILGASFAGLPMAHYLIKHLPPDYNITLISPSTHLYWNVASPRALVSPSLLGKKHTDLFVPLLPAFEKYPSGRFTFIQGKAISSAPSANTITVRTVSDGDGASSVREVNVEYSHLIIATGTSATSGNWGYKSTGKGTHTDTMAALASSRESIAAADRIVISGAGATGVELAGEIAAVYVKGGKKVTLLSSGGGLLPMVREDVGKAAEYHLKKMGVEIRDNVKVESETRKGNITELVLSTGETLEADLHITTWGMSPNTSFLSKDLLDGGGWVVTDKYLKTPTHSNIWALGDVTHWGNRNLSTIESHHEVVAANVVAAINGKEETTFKEYKHKDRLLLLIPIGPRFASGTGILVSWRVWGLFAWLLKGRTYVIEGNRPIAEGKHTSGRTKI